jgi:hypothetical protein
MTLRRFWFKFAGIKPYHSLRLECGITAHGRDGAINILRSTVFAGQEFPRIESVAEDVDIRTLDQKHVIPNMEPPIWRGIWFPKGYTRPS